MIISTRSPHRLGLLLIGAVLAAGISSVAVVSSDSPASAAACQGCIVVSAPSINLNVTARPGEQAVIDKEGGVAVYTPLTTAAIGGPGTVWLVGHRTTHGSVFNRVPSLQAGDVVNLVDDAGTHQYIVSRLLVVSASGWANQVNIYDMSHSRLILQTSHPDSNLRYLIEAFASVPEPCRTTPLAIGGSTLSTATTRFVAVPPQRLLDTRTDGAGAVCAGGNVELQIAGVAGISATATAVALTVTATGAGGPGFVAVGPLGVDPSATSSVNLSAGGQTRANLVMVAIGQAGRIVLHSSVATHLVVDVAGYYEPSITSRDGRFVDVASQRLLDTRSDQAQHRLIANQPVTVNVVARASGVPVDGASAVLVNLTALNGTPPGYVTAWATGSPQPVTSNVNLSGIGSAAANLAIVPLGADGTMQVAASADLDLIIDIVGYFTNANALDSTIGLFVPLEPRRLLDTRGTQALLSANSISNFDLLGPAGIAGPVNLVTNLTSTGSLGQGFLAITEGPVPTTSNLNVSKGETRANTAVIYIRNSELMHLYVSLPTHVIIDVTGYFTAELWLHKFGAIRLPV